MWRVLGRYEPSELASDAIEREIRPLLPACCQRERISVRVPMGIPPHEDNLEWHQDGGGTEGTIRHMVVWASEQPTELKTPEGSWHAAPYELVWFDNDQVFHRQPRDTNPSSRWVVSVRCSGA